MNRTRAQHIARAEELLEAAEELAAALADASRQDQVDTLIWQRSLAIEEATAHALLAAVAISGPVTDPAPTPKTKW